MSSKPAPEPGRRPWSLAARLTAWHAASAFGLAAAAAGMLYAALVAGLDAAKDQFLADEVQILRGLLRDRPDDANALRQEVEWEAESRRHDQVYVRVLDAGGTPVLATAAMDAVAGPDAFPAPIAADAEPEGGADLAAADGRPLRGLAARAVVGRPGAPVWTLQVALRRTDEAPLLAQFRGHLALVLGLALVASSAGGVVLARRAVGPIRAVAATARRVRAATLGERVHAAAFPAELADLAATLNAMLDRLEEAFHRLARFSADIAHELRTPVNNLRGVAEVALNRPRDAAAYREALGSCLEEAVRLSHLIDRLLFLARAENPRTQIAFQPLDTARELEAVRGFYEAAAEEAGVGLTAAAPAGLTLRADRALWQRAVGNLVENALTHTPRGGAVTLAAEAAGAEVRVTVADTGRGIDAAHLPHLGERFYRADPSRTAGTGGVGLGLAIVRGIMDLHGGTLAIASTPSQGTRVTLTFPGPS